MERRLAAILAADVVGYSRLMAADEKGTHARLKALRQDFVEPKISEHHGRVVKLMGDGALVEFASVVDAVECAAAIQAGVAERQTDLPEQQRIIFRIGINLGDVIAEEGDIFGDGVNIAARLEGLAEPGGIVISGTAYDQVKNKLDVGFEFQGEQRVKNVAEPVRVYRVALDGPRTRRVAMGKAKRLSRVWAAAAAAVLVAAACAIALWHSTGGPEPGVAADDVLALPSGPSIAVLPFDNPSGDFDHEYFADGIIEDIITRLAQYKDFLVYARSTMFQYKRKSVNIVTLAKTLGADYVVEGSVRRQADSVRITAQLLDAQTGGHVWTESYDRALTAGNILDIQDEIATAIAHQIGDPHGEISVRETAQSGKGRPRTLESYDCLLKFFAYERLITLETHSTARECLERAIENDPAAPDSWWALASLYVDEMLDFPSGTRQASSSFERAVAAGEKAVKLAPKNARAHAALSRVLFFAGESRRARDEAETAIVLSPNDAEVLGLAVEALSQTGKFQRGYDHLLHCEPAQVILLRD